MTSTERRRLSELKRPLYRTIANLSPYDRAAFAVRARVRKLSATFAGPRREYVVIGGPTCDVDAFLMDAAEWYPTAELVLDIPASIPHTKGERRTAETAN